VALSVSLTVLLVVIAVPVSSGPAFTPRRPIEWTIPAGTGGGADQQARFMAPVIAKHNLSPQPFIPVNRPAGAGAQAFLWMIDKSGDPHTILITLDNLFATPQAQLNRPPSRRTVQLARPHAERPAAARQLRALGACGLALEDAGGV